MHRWQQCDTGENEECRDAMRCDATRHDTTRDDDDGLPLTCCSRFVIMLTACCRIVSLVWGFSASRWMEHMRPSSLNASFISLTRTLWGRRNITHVVRGRRRVHTCIHAHAPRHTPSPPTFHLKEIPLILRSTGLKPDHGWVCIKQFQKEFNVIFVVTIFKLFSFTNKSDPCFMNQRCLANWNCIFSNKLLRV